jgi:hypothetical protein
MACVDGTAVSVYIARATGGPDKLSALREWLVEEDDLRGRVCWAPAVVGPGQMRTVGDVRLVAVGSGGVLTVLASSLPTWLTRRGSDIEITPKKNPDGRRTEVEASRVRADELLARLGELAQAGKRPE